MHAFFDLGVQRVEFKVRGGELKQRARLRLFCHLVKPVAMGEAQKAFKARANLTLEAAHAVGVVDFKALERFNQTVGVHQQRSLLKMRNHEQQEMLMAKLRQHAAIATTVEVRLRIPDDNQGVTATQVTRIGRGTFVGPETVVAISFLKVGQIISRKRHGAGARRHRHFARTGAEPQPNKVVARNRAWLVHAEVSHDRHAVILNLAIAQRARLPRVIADQRLQHERPVRCRARRAVLADVLQERVALLGVGAGQHLAGCIEPFSAGQTMQRLAVGVPSGWVAAAKAVQQLLRLRQRQVVGADLNVEQHKVNVVEKVQINVLDIEHNRREPRLRDHPHLRDILAAEHPHRRA